METITLEIGQRLRVRLPYVDELTYAMVDDVVDDEMIIGVSVPPRRPSRGETVTVEWGAPRGWHSLPMSFEGLYPSGFETWRMRPCGPVNLQQRRGFCRAAVWLPVLLIDISVEDDPRTIGGTTLDIGEGGVRLALRRGHELRPESRIRLLLASDDLDLDTTGTVVRLVKGPERDEVAIRFDQPVTNSTQLRRAVLRLQQRERSLRIG